MSVRSMMLETLENRALLSANAFLEGDVLHVRGAGDASNTIVVGNSADGLSVNVSINVARKNGVTKTFTGSFPVSLGINKVRISGGRANDTITIDQTNSPFAIKTRINAHNGDDVIVGGDEIDLVDAGRGNDNVSTGAGDDFVVGRAGNDTILGGEGNDRLWGGRGDDSIDGGNGNDVLGGLLGVNTLMGGAGSDTFYVRSLEKNPVNDFNAAEDVQKGPKTKPHSHGANTQNDDPQLPKL
jgi:Ca2+-binding RTX toxin-like protein